MTPPSSPSVSVVELLYPTVTRMKVMPREMIAITEKIAVNHPITMPPVSSVRQNKKLLTVGNLQPILVLIARELKKRFELVLKLLLLKYD